MAQFDMNPQGPDSKRLLLAVVMTSAVLMLYSYFFSPVPPVQEPVAEVAKPEKKDVEVKEEQPVAEAVAHSQATNNVAPFEKNFLVKEKSEHEGVSTSYDAKISNVGGLISHFALVDFSQPQVLFDEAKLGSSLMSLRSDNPKARLFADAHYELVSSDENHLKLRHVTKEGLSVERFYQFKDKAQIAEQITIKNISQAPIKVEAVLSGIKHDDAVKTGFLNPGVQGQSIVIKTDDKYQKVAYSDLKDKGQSFSSIKYAGFDDQFFLATIMPEYSKDIDHVTAFVKEQEDGSKNAHIDVALKPFVLVLGEEKVLAHQFFIGPKQVDLLASLPIKLDENIDFGWFGVLSRPMLWMLVQIYGFVGNYGIAIILITFVIKLLTYPLTQKSFSSQQEMKKLQPQIKELQQKYSHDRNLLGQKTMELYKTHGVNPVAGCLPLLIQLPIWFAFFQMLRNSVELFDQPFYGWITDLTRPDQYLVLPILMGLSMFAQQAFTPPPADQPQMKYVMWSMPVFLTFIMLNMPSGLSLYILTNNLLTILQQLIIKRKA